MCAFLIAVSILAGGFAYPSLVRTISNSESLSVLEQEEALEGAERRYVEWSKRAEQFSHQVQKLSHALHRLPHEISALRAAETRFALAREMASQASLRVQRLSEAINSSEP